MPEKTYMPTLNRILSRLSQEEFGLLLPHLTAVDLPVRKQLESRNKPIEAVYFIEHGFASVVADGTGRSIEVGLVGREGMTGLSIILGAGRSPHETFMQAGGDGQRISSAKHRRAIEQSPALHRSLLRYCHAFMVQTAQTALANGRSKIEERLARWLLMAHDRLDGDEVPLTQEFLSVMLGMRRPGVTVALNVLEKRVRSCKAWRCRHHRSQGSAENIERRLWRAGSRVPTPIWLTRVFVQKRTKRLTLFSRPSHTSQSVGSSDQETEHAPSGARRHLSRRAQCPASISRLS
jgi:CRP-like cAMP-binding protein